MFDREGNRKYLNLSERLRFYRAALRLRDPSDRAFCLTLYYTGCRISEALWLTRGNVDQEDGTLIFRTLKQREKKRFRAVPVAEELLLLLQTPDNAVLQERLWSVSRTTGWKLLKACMADAGIEGIKATPKGLRHGFAIACVNAGVPLPTIQKWMGHARLETTAIYLDFVGEDERELARKVWATAEYSREEA